MATTQASTKTEHCKLKPKEKDLKEATKSSNLDTVLTRVKKLDNTCPYGKCKTRTSDFAIECKFCNGRFCTSHGLPEIHGCGEAVRREEKRQYLHPLTKLSQQRHSQVAEKLDMKLKLLESDRKGKRAKRGKK